MSACPICSRPAVQEYRPFCSKRCADLDLHRWLNESYRVPTDDIDIEEDSVDPRPDDPTRL